MNLTFTNLLTVYDINNPKVHKYIWESLYHATNKTNYLKKHRDYIEKFNYGYGDRPFHYMWKMLINTMPENFKFLEIGVFKGQIISLIQLLSKKQHKKVEIYGITPLTDRGDKYSTHPEIDYLKAIKKIYKDFNLSFSNTRIIKGLSQNPSVIKEVEKNKPFNIVYIDGCHNYKEVASDIKNYTDFVKMGGFLIIDDSASFMKLPKYVNKGRDFLTRLLPINKIELFKGLREVSMAVENELKENKNFKHIFSCGHNRVWMRI